MGLSIKGFTILEAIIAMMLTSMLAVLVISGIGFYQKMFGVVVESGEKQREIDLFYQSFKTDLSKSRVVNYEGEIIMNFDDGTSVFYQFHENMIVKSSVVTVDTFFISSSLGEIRMLNNSEELTEFVEIQCLNGNLVFPLSFLKTYPAGIMMQSKDLWQ